MSQSFSRISNASGANSSPSSSQSTTQQEQVLPAAGVRIASRLLLVRVSELLVSLPETSSAHAPLSALHTRLSARVYATLSDAALLHAWAAVHTGRSNGGHDNGDTDLSDIGNSSIAQWIRSERSLMQARIRDFLDARDGSVFSSTAEREVGNESARMSRRSEYNDALAALAHALDVAARNVQNGSAAFCLYARALEQDEIERLAPVHEIDRENSVMKTSAACVICLCLFTCGDRARTYNPCQHVFHAHCLDVWLRASAPTCPLCRSLLAGADALVHAPRTP